MIRVLHIVTDMRRGGLETMLMITTVILTVSRFNLTFSHIAVIVVIMMTRLNHWEGGYIIFPGWFRGVVHINRHCVLFL